MAETKSDLVIIGGGPAGLTAALFAGRARLDTVLLEAAAPGGEVALKDSVETYPGFPDGVSGFELGELMRRQAEAFGARLVSARAEELAREDGGWVVRGNGDRFRAPAVIAATGERHRDLGVPGEADLQGRGVSTNAIRDGSFFRDRPVAVVGDGAGAAEAAVFLARFCSEVHLVVAGADLVAAQVLRERVRASERIEAHRRTRVERVLGEAHVRALALRTADAAESVELPVAGVFLYSGWAPRSELLAPYVARDDAGYVRAGEDTRTGVPGLFVAGDVRVKPLRRTVTAVADGATAARQVAAYLREDPAGEDG